jgi:hypothetical protein
MEQIMIYKGVEYLLNNTTKTAIVKAPTVGVARLLVIPNCVICDGVVYKVTEIGKNAFWQHIHIDGIVLPATIQVIRAYAFQGSSLHAFSREKTDKMLKIEKSAFEACSRLQHVEFNGPVTLAEPDVFYRCVDLQRMDSSHIYGEIPTGCFHDCKKMSDFYFDYVTDISPDAFHGVQFKRVFVLSTELWSNDTSFLTAISNARIYCSEKCRLLDLAYEGFDIRC